ncbi:hypothetical protein ACFY5K_36440 [Streptomyces griseofuscus]|uniref:hypothetical protein n=1 Tax=Streptomyces griseofuscus TaxID=146922 RepID=UPI0036AA5F32
MFTQKESFVTESADAVIFYSGPNFTGKSYKVSLASSSVSVDMDVAWTGLPKIASLKIPQGEGWVHLATDEEHVRSRTENANVKIFTEDCADTGTWADTATVVWVRGKMRTGNVDVSRGSIYDRRAGRAD